MSSLLELDSSFTQSTTGESATTTQSYSKKKRSPVWVYCRDLTKDEDQELLYCSRCTIDYPEESPYSSKISENMKKHLFSRHGINVPKAISKGQQVTNEQLRQLYYQVEANGDTNEFDTQILSSCLNKAVIIEALISLIVVQNLSFCLIEWPKFYTLCQALNLQSKGMITIAHQGVYNKVTKAWEKHKDVVRQELQVALSRIHISLDIQTSPNRWLLLAICAYFTTHLQTKQKALLALKKVPGHSGEDQFLVLLLVLKDYNIVKQLGPIIANNALLNNVLYRHIESHWD